MTVKRKPLIANFEARSVLLIAGWTLGAAGAALAQNMPAPAPAASDKATSAAFTQADKNGDGQLSRELLALLTAAVARACDDLDWEGVQRPELLAGSVGADARALGGALLPLHANFGLDRELFLKAAAEG